VERVIPICIERVRARLQPAGGRRRPIRVIAFDTDFDLFPQTQILEFSGSLRENGAAICDIRSKKTLGLPTDLDNPAPVENYSLAGKNLKLVGRFTLGTDFANEGNLVMSESNYVHFFGTSALDPLQEVSLAAVYPAPGVPPDVVLRDLQKHLGDGLRIVGRQGLIDNERRFWDRNTPIGYIFNVGVAMGFLVGVIICYQIIHTNLAEYVAEFATLKAMGYRNPYFVGLVVTQSVYLALLGFVPGLAASWCLYGWLDATTGLPMILSQDRAGWVGILTLAMCILSGSLAIRKVLSADPAELF
jgi:putative ABC transport system permease protein